MPEKFEILIVDDRRENLVALRQVLREVDAEIVEATTGNEALAATLNHDFALAILDVQMPGMSGYELAEHLRGDKKTQMIPIVFVTAAYADEEHRFLGYEAGGVDYLTKPYSPEVMRSKVNIFLEMARYRRELERHRDHLETLVAERTGQLNKRVKELECLYAVSSLVAGSRESIDDTLETAVSLIPPGWQYPEITRARILFKGREFVSEGFKDTPWKLSSDIVVSGNKLGSVEVCYLEERPALDEGPFLKEERDQIIDTARQLSVMIGRKQAEEVLQRTLESLRNAVNTTIQVIISTVEVRDPYTVNHQLRSADLARAIATEMKLSQDRVEGIWIAGSIHDLGKLSIPAEILSKPTRLTDIEFSLIKEHPRKGYEILKNVESSWPLAEVVYQHHERMDGSGYPRNLKGDEILMEARILAVCDVVESMASHRPYRAALGIDAALEEIEDNRGVLYDADVVDACLRLFREKNFNLNVPDFER